MTFQTMPDTTPKTTANMDKYPPTSKGAMSMPNRVVVTTKIAHQRIANIIMGMSHRVFPLHGVQFHPESFLTEYGFMLVENFLHLGPLGNVRSGRWHADMAVIGEAN